MPNYDWSNESIVPIEINWWWKRQEHLKVVYYTDKIEINGKRYLENIRIRAKYVKNNKIISIF